MWVIEGDRLCCTECDAEAPLPHAPCGCVQEEPQATDSGQAYSAAFAQSLAIVERHVLDSLRVAEPGSSVYIAHCQALLKISEFRHSAYLKHQEAVDVERLSDALDEINSHLAGHSASGKRLAEDAASQASASAGD